MSQVSKSEDGTRRWEQSRGWAGMRLGGPEPWAPRRPCSASQDFAGLGVMPGSWHWQKHLGHCGTDVPSPCQQQLGLLWKHPAPEGHMQEGPLLCPGSMCLCLERLDRGGRLPYASAELKDPLMSWCGQEPRASWAAGRLDLTQTSPGSKDGTLPGAPHGVELWHGSLRGGRVLLGMLSWTPLQEQTSLKSQWLRTIGVPHSLTHHSHCSAPRSHSGTLARKGSPIV